MQTDNSIVHLYGLNWQIFMWLR